MKIIDLSYYIVNNYSKLSTEGITPLKLQKLLYYVYVWGIVSKDKILDTQFEKWAYGPVNSEVYHHFKGYGTASIPADKSKKLKLSSAKKSFLEFIIHNYIKYDAITLSAMTHKDMPWQEADQNSIISENAIRKFYGKLNFAKNFPLGETKYFYPVETDLHYAYILDMPPNVGKKIIYFDSYKEYLKLEKQSKKAFEKQIKARLPK